MANSVFKKNFKYLLIFLVLSFLFYFLDTRGYLNFLHQAADFFAVPVKKQIFRKGQMISSISSCPNEKRKIKTLENEVRKLLVESEKRKTLEEENRALRKQLETPLPPQWEYQDVKVIGFNNDLSIDKGEKQGLKINQIVLSQNILVGKIKELSVSQSLVELPTHPQSKIPVLTGRTGARGILKGEFGTELVLENVLQEEKLEVGDLILTSGEGNFPKGILIGKITKVIKKETEIYQKAEVKPLLNYQDLETIFVLVKQ